jgi:ornithine carbamoyltransferase
MKDTARVLGRMYDGIEYRGFGQQIVEELAKYAGVPVWNGLTNEFHPTQILADFMTMLEHSGKPLNKISFCYLGDARYNMGNSLLVGASKMGMDFRTAAPAEFQQGRELIETCLDISKIPSKINITDNNDAVRGWTFFTPTFGCRWATESVWEERIKLLGPYQVNMSVLKKP